MAPRRSDRAEISTIVEQQEAKWADDGISEGSMDSLDRKILGIPPDQPGARPTSAPRKAGTINMPGPGEEGYVMTRKERMAMLIEKRQRDYEGLLACQARYNKSPAPAYDEPQYLEQPRRIQEDRNRAPVYAEPSHTRRRQYRQEDPRPAHAEQIIPAAVDEEAQPSITYRPYSENKHSPVGRDELRALSKLLHQRQRSDTSDLEALYARTSQSTGPLSIPEPASAAADVANLQREDEYDRPMRRDRHVREEEAHVDVDENETKFQRIERSMREGLAAIKNKNHKVEQLSDARSPSPVKRQRYVLPPPPQALPRYQDNMDGFQDDESKLETIEDIQRSLEKHRAILEARAANSPTPSPVKPTNRRSNSSRFTKGEQKGESEAEKIVPKTALKTDVKRQDGIFQTENRHPAKIEIEQAESSAGLDPRHEKHIPAALMGKVRKHSRARPLKKQGVRGTPRRKSAARVLSFKSEDGASSRALDVDDTMMDQTLENFAATREAELTEEPATTDTLKVKSPKEKSSGRSSSSPYAHLDIPLPSLPRLWHRNSASRLGISLTWLGSILLTFTLWYSLESILHSLIGKPAFATPGQHWDPTGPIWGDAIPTVLEMALGWPAGWLARVPKNLVFVWPFVARDAVKEWAMSVGFSEMERRAMTLGVPIASLYRSEIRVVSDGWEMDEVL